jgi:hypothetical protein
MAVAQGGTDHSRSGLIQSRASGGDRSAPRSHLPRMVESWTREDAIGVGVS